MKACTQCGRCCTNESFMSTMQATAKDVSRWRRQRRHDILRFVDVYGKISEAIGLGYADLWIGPDGEERRRCPFVRKVRNQPRYTCTIYETRPEVCREYPTNVDHMKFVDCKMLESSDTNETVAAWSAAQGSSPRSIEPVAAEPQANKPPETAQSSGENP